LGLSDLMFLICLSLRWIATQTRPKNKKNILKNEGLKRKKPVEFERIRQADKGFLVSSLKN
jgi:hypothetical protein